MPTVGDILGKFDLIMGTKELDYSWDNGTGGRTDFKVLNCEPKTITVKQIEDAPVGDLTEKEYDILKAISNYKTPAMRKSDRKMLEYHWNTKVHALVDGGLYIRFVLKLKGNNLAMFSIWCDNTDVKIYRKNYGEDNDMLKPEVFESLFPNRTVNTLISDEYSRIKLTIMSKNMGD